MVTPEKFKHFAAVQTAKAILKVLPHISDQTVLDSRWSKKGWRQSPITRREEISSRVFSSTAGGPSAVVPGTAGRSLRRTSSSTSLSPRTRKEIISSPGMGSTPPFSW